MKLSIIVIACVSLFGCANNTVLQQRIDQAEAKQHALQEQIDQVKNDADMCTSAVIKVREWEDALQKKADEAWELTKAREAELQAEISKQATDAKPGIEKKATELYHEVEHWVKEQTK